LRRSPPTVQAICSPGGSDSWLRCHPFFDIKSPTSKMLTFASWDANPTTEAGGFPRTYSSGKSNCMAFLMALAQLTMERHDAR
jgi:hypothetical protein